MDLLSSFKKSSLLASFGLNSWKMTTLCYSSDDGVSFKAVSFSRAQCSTNLIALGSMSLGDCMLNGGNGVLPHLPSGIGGRDDAIVCHNFKEESSFHHQRLSRLKA